MKVRIDFTDVEKSAISNEFYVRDLKSRKESGKYGNISFINETNVVYANFDERFIIATVKLISNVANLIKGILQFCEDYSEIWFSDNKTEEIKLVCPVKKVEKKD